MRRDWDGKSIPNQKFNRNCCLPSTRLLIISRWSRLLEKLGARVAVKGKIRDGYHFGDLGSLLTIPPPFRSGLVMIKSQHKATD